MKNLVIILFTILFSAQVSGQQDPQYTQYMYNMNIINPAYTGSTEGLAVGALYRSRGEYPFKYSNISMLGRC